MPESVSTLVDRWAENIGIDRTYSYGRHLGLVAPEILVDERDVGPDGDDYGPVQACIDFCNWCRHDAALRIDETCPDAWVAYYVDFYLAQVNNGGHGQFAHNLDMDPDALDSIARGLAAMGANDFLAVFEDFRAAVDTDPALRRVTMEGGGFGKIPPIIESLDDRFFKLDGTWRLIAQNAAWLMSLAAWTPLPVEALRARRAAVLASNPLYARRLAAREAHRRRAEPRDPLLTRVWASIEAALPTPKTRQRRHHDFCATLEVRIDAVVESGDLAEAKQILENYRRALRQCPRYPDPHDAAMASTLYADICWTLGERLGEAAWLEEAVAIYRQAEPKVHRGMSHSGVLAQMGHLLNALGELRPATTAYEEAIDVFGQVLALEDPAYHVSAHVGLAEAYLGQAKRRLDVAGLDRVLAALGHATSGNGNAWAREKRILAETLALRAELTKETFGLHRAHEAVDIAIAYYAGNRGRLRIQPGWTQKADAIRARLDGLAKTARA
ncbi:DMP19 family protein [Caulobacter sp. LARHSG274]